VSFQSLVRTLVRQFLEWHRGLFCLIRA